MTADPGIEKDTRQRLRVLGVIPARLESQRFPRKPLRPICGYAMIDWVYHRARQASSLDQLLVATDSQEIVEHCRSRKMSVLMTARTHRSGTDRVIEVMTRQAADVYVNIQGDEPMVTVEHIDLLLQPFTRSAETHVSTLKVAMSTADARDPNNVKVVTDCRDRALYFSRSVIPYDRDAPERQQYYKHLGLYAYSAAALQRFRSLARSRLEQIEKLEQLRFLENGIPITVVETGRDTIGVDTEEDLLRVEAYFRAEGMTIP